jgi:hypothetical protein
MGITSDSKWSMNKSSFLALSTERKTHFLSSLAHQITVCARGVYPEQKPEAKTVEKLSTFNEMQHIISGHLRNMLAGDEKRYPDEVFLNILLEEAEIGGCESELAIAFDFALRHLLPNK